MKINLKDALRKIKTEQPLVHCITNHISINDCANAVLALGGKPIMAEHPEEVAEITSVSKALAVNLGNISESRMESIMISGKTARERGIPVVIDAAGAACSSLRLRFSKNFIEKYRPSVIKGNEAEIRALCSLPFETKGVDSLGNGEGIGELALKTAKKFSASVLISGKADAVSDGKRTVLIENGSPLMPFVTGTGCMLNVVCGTFLSVCNPFESAVMSALTMGISGEYAEEQFSISGSISGFHYAIIDGLFKAEKLTEKAGFKIYE